MFELVSNYKPSGDQPEAIKELVEGIKNNKKQQVLLGATGTGKTFTIANVIKEVNKPTLVLAHNKTLAGQLYAELKELFPNNRVEFFISYYDYYQPEAYVPQSDTYIDKTSSINDEIDELRHSATNALISRKDVIVVASVSCIYGIGEKEEYEKNMLTLNVGDGIDRNYVLKKLVDMLYERNDIDFKRGSFRVRGDVIEIIPTSVHDKGIRIEFFGDEIDKISEFDVVTGRVFVNKKTISIFPASFFVTSEETLKKAVSSIKEELKERLEELNNENFEQFINENNKVVVDLWAPWCGPCRALGPVLEEVCEENNVTLAKVNVDDNEELARKFNCQSIPMVILFENGKAVKQFIGYNSKQFVEDFIK